MRRPCREHMRVNLMCQELLQPVVNYLLGRNSAVVYFEP
jgi:hypothetical protein